MKLAFDNISSSTFRPTPEMLKEGFEAAASSPRKRIILPLHRTQDAKVQRMFNFLQPGTYIKPHYHPEEDAIESVIVMQGKLLFFVFDDKGQIIDEFILEAGTADAALFDFEPGIWHSFVVLEKDTLIYEVKKGPYTKANDKHFASWAADEGTEAAEKWVQEMEKRVEQYQY